MDFPLIETSRTHLRQISLMDADAIFLMYSDAESMQYRESRPLITREDAVELVSRYLTDFKNGIALRWGIELKENGQLIGTIVWKMSNPENEFGYSLDKNYWRRGLMLEVVLAVIQFLFEREELDYITARAKTPNIASQKLLEKAGFEIISREDTIVKYQLTFDQYLFRASKK